MFCLNSIDLLSQNHVYFTKDGLNYHTLTDYDLTVSVDGGDCIDSVIIIPGKVEYNGVKHPVTVVADYAFGQRDDIAEVYIETNRIWVGTYAFNSCKNLKKVIFPSLGNINVRDFSGVSIMDGAFSVCDNLKIICLPTPLYKCGALSFLSPNMSNVDIYINDPKPSDIKITPYGSINFMIWTNLIETCTLHVPIGTKNLYLSLDSWKGFKIEEMNFDNFSFNTTQCNLQDLSSTNPYYDATADLCSRNIISGSDSPSNFGAVNVTDTLKRKHLAKIAFRGLYSTNSRTVPTTLPSDNYPTVYDDLSTQTPTNAYYYQAAKALLYLEYGDGVSPFDRNKTNFNADNAIARVDVIKALLETFNIAPDLSNGTNPFPNDFDVIALKNNNPRKYGYILKAASLGIIATPSGDKNTKFRPFDKCLRGEAFVMLDRIIVAIENGTITDPNPQNSSYFEPLNVTLETIAMGLSLQQGNFDGYSKKSFSIDGIMPLDFEHSYNSSSTELPTEFFGAIDLGQGKSETYKTLGSGWSHTYNTFATQIDDKLVVHWGDGKTEIYQSLGNPDYTSSGAGSVTWPNFSPLSVGVYNLAYNFHLPNSDTDLEGKDNNNFIKRKFPSSALNSSYDSVLYIMTKSNLEYTFKKIKNSGLNILQLHTITDRNGNTLTINYKEGLNSTMVISSVTDGNRELKFSYKTGTNLISQINDPLNRKVKFDYTFNQTSNEYQLTKYTDANNQATNYLYGTSNDLNQCKLLKKIQLPKGNYIENEYDLNRRLTKSVTGLNGIPSSQTTVSVNTDYQNGTTSSDVEIKRGNDITKFKNTYNKYNSATNITGENDLNVNNIFGDADHKELPTSISSNNRNIDEIQYDQKGNILRIVKKSMSGDDVHRVEMTYNKFNDVLSFTDPEGNRTDYNYDSKGNLININDPKGNDSYFTVNERGLTIQSEDVEGVITEYDYNEYGNQTTLTIPALNLVSKNEYDNASRIIKAIDFKGLQTSYEYDDNDNLLTKKNAMNYVTRNEYDLNDNLKSVFNAKGGETKMTYDATTDWLTSVTFGGAKKQYRYNEDGSIKNYIKPDGKVLNYTYDNLGSILSDGINTYSYDSNLRLSTITRKGKTLTYGYDGFNRIISVDYSDFINNKVRYEYDKNGNVTSLIYPGGKTVNYTYDNNRMATVTDWNNKTITYNYRKDNQLQSIIYPNGMTVSFAYDETGRQISKTTTRTNGSAIASYTFKLDNIGNIIQEDKNEPFVEITSTTGEETYNIDLANKILNAGNKEFIVDINGNTTKRDNSTYTWDEANKLINGDGLTFEYDGLGNRRSKGNKRYILDVNGLGNVLAETDAAGNPTSYYLYGVGLEARIKTDGTTEYYVSDYRGSTVAMVDATNDAIVTHKYQYDEFGNITQIQETDTNPFRYIGRHGVMYENDHLMYMRARYYDPTIGRFLSEDPVWSTNLYSYVENNPINFLDIDGRKMNKVSDSGLMTPKDNNNPNESNDTSVEKKQTDGGSKKSKLQQIKDETAKELKKVLCLINPNSCTIQERDQIIKTRDELLKTFTNSVISGFNFATKVVIVAGIAYVVIVSAPIVLTYATASAATILLITVSIY